MGGLLFFNVIIGTIGSKQIKIKPAYLISGGASGLNFYNNFNSNFIKIFLFIFSTTIFIIFLYSIMGLRLLDSVNLSFTTISSGGFIPNDNLTDILRNDLQTFVFSLTLLFPIFNFFYYMMLLLENFYLKIITKIYIYFY